MASVFSTMIFNSFNLHSQFQLYTLIHPYTPDVNLLVLRVPWAAQIFMQCRLNGRQKCLKMLGFKHAVRTVAWQGSLAWLLLILVLSNAWNVNWKMLSYEFLAFYGQKEGSEIWSFHSSAECHICPLSEWESDRFTSYFLTTLIWDLKLNHSKQIKSSKKWE